MRMQYLPRTLAAILLALPLLAAAPAADKPTAEKLEEFTTPDAAIDAMITAIHNNDGKQLRALFGKAGLETIRAGDPVDNQEQRRKFIDAYNTRHAIDVQDGVATLTIGASDWPFPIPLKRAAQGWYFDMTSGLEEILDRRIGANELSTQQVVLAYVDAQQEYAQSLHDGNKLHVYAQKFLSSPGKQNGLYWPTQEGQASSPLGPLIAEARGDGYRPDKAGRPEPFHGYYFRILNGQGAHAVGGAYDYVVRGQMLGGFGLVAWPALWGNTGVMTFIVNQDGNIYQKDLGSATEAVARKMKLFDPDGTWQKIDPPAPVADDIGAAR